MNATSAEKTRRDDDDRSAIVVAGREVRLGRGVRVVRWHDADGMSAYATSPPLGPTAPGHAPEVAAAMRPTDVAPAPRHGVRRRVHALSDDLGAIVGEDVSDATMTTEEEIRDAIDKVVIHYDACGSSAKCFDVLHNQRGLSCHFLIDVDGTIYQTLDARERAWHATTSDDLSARGTYEGDAPFAAGSPLASSAITPTSAARPRKWPRSRGGASTANNACANDLLPTSAALAQQCFCAELRSRWCAGSRRNKTRTNSSASSPDRRPPPSISGGANAPAVASASKA